MAAKTEGFLKHNLEEIFYIIADKTERKLDIYIELHCYILSFAIKVHIKIVLPGQILLQVNILLGTRFPGANTIFRSD